jgi:hypothetical protein
MPRNKIRSNQVSTFDGSVAQPENFDIQILTSSSLQIGAGRVRRSDGTTWTFAGGTLPLAHINSGDGTWYIGIDPNDSVTNSEALGPICPKMHALGARIHSCMVWLAKITRTGSTVVINERYAPEWPKSAITRFKRKCAASNGTSSIGSPVRIAVIGTSLSNFTLGSSNASLATANTNCNWYSLLFSSGGLAANYRIPGIATVNLRFTVDNVSMGSNNHMYHAMWLADCIEGVSQANGLGQAWAVRPGSLSKRAAASQKSVLRSPFFSQPYDLVILDSLPNGGSHKLAHIDNIVRKLRAVGTEVVLVTGGSISNPSYTDGAAIYHDGIRLIAENRGCDIADRNGFLKERIDLFSDRADAINDTNGNTTNIGILNDTIHPTYRPRGEGIVAEAIRSVINDLPQEAKAANPLVSNRLLYADETLNRSTQAPFFPAHYEFCAFPAATSGTITYEAGNTTIYNTGGGIPAGVKMPETAFGGKTAGSTSAADAPLMVLGAGASVRFSHPFAVGATLLVQNDSVSWGITATDGTNTLLTLTEDGSNGTRGMHYDITTVGVTTNWLPTQSNTQAGGPFWNGSITINRTSGSPKIRGILWHVPGEVEDFIPADMVLTGTWNNTTADAGTVLGCRGTNSSVATDYAEFVCEGRMAFLHLEQGTAGGFVDVWVNGFKVLTGAANNAGDLYRASIGHAHIKVIPPTSMAPASGLPSELGTSQRMHIRVAYNGSQNASAVAASGDNYRLKVCGVSVIK